MLCFAAELVNKRLTEIGGTLPNLALHFFFDHIARPPHCCPSMQQAHYQQMKEIDWGTPPEIAAASRQFMGGIDLDPASSKERNTVIQAKVILGVEDADAQIGVPCEWGKAQTIFINPPGGCRPDKFNEKTGKWSGPSLVSLFWQALAAHLEDNPYAVFTWVAYNINQLQTLQQVDAALFSKCVVCVPSSRVSYLDKAAEPVGGTPSASAILGYCANNGKTNLHMFARAFEKIGMCWSPVK